MRGIGRRSRRLESALATGVIGTALLLLGAIVAPAHAAASYLVAYTATLAVFVGMILLVPIAHLSGAVWFVVFRPRAEAVISALPVLGIFTLPLVFFPGAFWPLAASSAGSSPADPGRVPPLHAPHLIARTLAYWVIWLSVSELLLRWSQQQQRDGIAADRLAAGSAATIVLVSLTATFAAFDWMMSLSPGWSSTVYGVYYCTGGLLAALALLATLAWRDRRTGVPFAPTAEHVHAMARLMLAFVLFWAYLWYAQFFIIWIADIPREVGWYIVRLGGGWSILAATILVGGFAVPFVILLFRLARRSPTFMGLIGWLLLVVHYLDVYWLVVPGMRPDWRPRYLVWDLGALAAMAGLSVSLAIVRRDASRRPGLVDPRLQWALRYEAR